MDHRWPAADVRMKLPSPGSQYHTHHPCRKRQQRRGWVRLRLTWKSHSSWLFWRVTESEKQQRKETAQGRAGYRIMARGCGQPRLANTPSRLEQQSPAARSFGRAPLPTPHSLKQHSQAGEHSNSVRRAGIQQQWVSLHYSKYLRRL